MTFVHWSLLRFVLLGRGDDLGIGDSQEGANQINQ